MVRSPKAIVEVACFLLCVCEVCEKYQEVI